MVGFALAADSPQTWADTATVLRARLDVTERGSLALAALRSMPRDLGVMTAQAALGEGNSPQPALFSAMDQAAFWADTATPSELDAYCLASFMAMDKERQAAFLSYATEATA